MKKLILTIGVLFITGICLAQDTLLNKLPIKNGGLVYEKVVEMPGKSKIDLYNNAKQWFVDYFKSSKDVIQNEDKEQGRITGKGIALIPFKGGLGTTFMYDQHMTIQVDCKDGKYRYRVYDIYVNSPVVATRYGINQAKAMDSELIGKVNGTGKCQFSKKQCARLLESIDFQVNETARELNMSMSAKSNDF